MSEIQVNTIKPFSGGTVEVTGDISASGKLIAKDRAKIYGDALANHKRIAKLWSVLLEKDITPQDVYKCMIAVKLARLIETPKHLDSVIDIIGYGALYGEITDD